MFPQEGYSVQKQYNLHLQNDHCWLSQSYQQSRNNDTFFNFSYIFIPEKWYVTSKMHWCLFYWLNQEKPRRFTDRTFLWTDQSFQTSQGKSLVAHYLCFFHPKQPRVKMASFFFLFFLFNFIIKSYSCQQLLIHFSLASPILLFGSYQFKLVSYSGGGCCGLSNLSIFLVPSCVHL